ncbi:Lipoprotein-releasing system ATP-binding protein LolD [Methyloligella halotolerans]|uniref:Lipoprotein-releasing system ATP-binding protein LolD n=1 Tax=Methyloligella halotolerans TaxID=1177755 RepID=A0A1E2RWL6_9HYPH|nr:ABC transporter ATP-binding protein [Methyloligella halotolerans]ODA66601.1 Lipoprotein-releasing system ATP-binding protein LolD [Methyloligella halotolerans]
MSDVAPPKRTKRRVAQLDAADTAARPETATAQIVARDLCKTYVMGGSAVHALQDVNLEIAAGEYVAVTGQSGSGKSTFMNLIGALDQPTSGTLTVDGADLGKLSTNALAQYRNEKIGFVFQTFNLLPRTSALDNVALPLLYAQDTGDAKARARVSLERVGLAERAAHEPSALSGGQQQRVAIARALVNAPKILLADEPTGALDSKTTEEIIALFEDLNESGITVIIVTHELDIAARAKRQITFQDGRVVEDRS